MEHTLNSPMSHEEEAKLLCPHCEIQLKPVGFHRITLEDNLAQYTYQSTIVLSFVLDAHGSLYQSSEA